MIKFKVKQKICNGFIRQKYVSYSNQQKMALFLIVPVKSTTFDSKKNKKVYL